MAQGANTFQIVSPVGPDIAQAERVVASTYGDTVSVLEKKKDLLKFGRNFAAGTSYSTVWAYGDTLATEVLPTTNAIDTVSSSSTSDTGTVVIEGHTISGSDLTFVVQTATLNGRNKVVLTTPLARATRIKNTGAADFVGDIYVYEDDTISAGVPTTSTKVHVTARAGYGNQSLKCATSISSVDYWFISHIKCGVLKKIFSICRFPTSDTKPR